MKNIVIIDLDVRFSNLIRNMRNEDGGFVSLEYYYDVDDGRFAQLENLDLFYSTEDEPTVFGVLAGLKPFDGISTGAVSLAKTQLDKNPNVPGHSRKMRETLGIAEPDRTLRICHTVNLFRQNAGVLKMYCRSFYVDPDTLEHETANPGPGTPPPLEAKSDDLDAGPGDIRDLFDFLAIRKQFRQKTTKNYRLDVLTPMQDYDMFTVKTLGTNLDFDRAFKMATDWLNEKRDSGELDYDRSSLRVTALNYGKDRKPRQSTDGVIAFINMRVSDSFEPGVDQALATLDGKTLPVRKSQPLRIFSIVPTTDNPYRLCESTYIDFLAHMLDDCRW